MHVQAYYDDKTQRFLLRQLASTGRVRRARLPGKYRTVPEAEAAARKRYGAACSFSFVPIGKL